MRIAYISYEYPPDTGLGGIGTYTKQAAILMSRRGHDIHVFCAGFKDNIIVEQGISIHKIASHDPADFSELVLDIFRNEHSLKLFDCIESAEINCNARYIKAAFPGLPLVVRLHTPNWLVEKLKKKYTSGKDKWRFFLGALRRGRWDLGYWRRYDPGNDPERDFTLSAESVTAPSKAMKQWAFKKWGMEENRISIFPNPFEPPPLLLIQHEAEENIILFFGRLNVLKGLVGLTIAIKGVLKKHRHWKMIFIGNDGPSLDGIGSMKSWMQKKIHKVNKQVEFIEGLPYDQLMEKIVVSEIIVLPSLFESFSYTCAEAMAAGKPVVGSKNGGMAELLAGGAGITVDPLKPKKIAAAIESLINDKEGRKLIGAKARKKILEYCDNEKIGSQMEDVYKKAIQKKEVHV